jgi:hypothetical protein
MVTTRGGGLEPIYDALGRPVETLEGRLVIKLYRREAMDPRPSREPVQDAPSPIRARHVISTRSHLERLPDEYYRDRRVDASPKPADLPDGLMPRDRPATSAEREAHRDVAALQAQDEVARAHRRATKQAERRRFLAEHGIPTDAPRVSPTKPSRSPAARAREFQKFKKSATYHARHPGTKAPLVDWEREKLLAAHDGAMRAIERASRGC